MWFRVELNKDGSVKSCTEVEDRLQGTRWVQYIHADDKAKAISEALAWLESYREKQRARHEKRVARLAALGRCRWCPNKLVPGVGAADLCPECSSKKKDRRRRRRRGESVEPGDGRGDVRKARAQLAALSRVRFAYLSNPAGFASWLDAEIRRIEAAAHVSADVCAEDKTLLVGAA